MAASENPPESESQQAAIERLVFECLESEDVEQTVAEIRREQPELADRVQSALQALEFGHLLGAEDVTPDSTLERVPKRLGPFRLIRELGAGGMGIVYLAEQEDLGRQVALKLIRPEQLFFPGSRERFRREVEAVARLQHPGIVSVFTVGEDEGLPYFSMEYVDGLSVSQVLRALADKNPADLTGADLAALLRKDGSVDVIGSQSDSRRAIFARGWTDVCVDIAIRIADALEHAHRRGVLHRDIKPSNILITTDGRARLVDFGLARTEGAQQMTASTAQIGSLPYLPPEMLDAKACIPSDRQDVYSLGVTLYEMLAIQSPFLGTTSETTRQNILGGNPPSLRERNPSVSWDLETVCLTAMDQDPTHRYGSIGDLLADLENVWHSRPIAAKRPRVWLRLRRWEQRHPTATVAGLVAVVLVVLASMVFAVMESAARRQSERLTRAAERKATEASEVTEFLVDLFRYASPDKALGDDLPVRLLLQQGADRIARGLKGQPEVAARLLRTFGHVHSWLGEHSKSAAFYKRAANLFAGARGPDDRDALECRIQVAAEWIRVGRFSDVEAEVAAVAELTDGWPDGDPLAIETMRVKALLLEIQGDVVAAARLHREHLAEHRKHSRDPRGLATAIRNFATVLKNQDEHEEAQLLFDECLALQRQSYPQGHPALVLTMHPAAMNLAALGRFDAARELARAAVTETERIFGPNHPRLAVVLNSSAIVHRESGNTAAAISTLERVLTIVRGYRDVSKNYYARSLNDLAVSYHNVGKYDDARQLLEEALSISRATFEGDHILTAFLMQNLGGALGELGDAAAESSARAGLQMLLRLNPDAREVARAINALAWVLIRVGTPENLAEAADLIEDAIIAAAKWPSQKWSLGRAHALRALLANRAGKGEDAERDARRALELYRTVRRADHPAKAIALYNLAWSRLLQQDAAAAEPMFRQSIEMYERMGQGYPEKAYPLNHYGFMLLERRPADAVPLLEEALAIRRRVLPKHSQWLMITTLNLAMAHVNLQEYAKAETLMLEVHDGVLSTMGRTSAAAVASAKRLVRMYEAWGRPKRAELHRVLAEGKR